tara:strand:- start:53 stop:436 length:384 start_codon:yes stop_codon:yes gene_type:complete
MIKQFIINTCLSTTIILTLFLLDSSFSFVFSPFFYIAPAFFFILYSIQSILLNIRQLKPPVFVLVYNLSTFIKLILSALFIISYYLLFASNLENQQKIQFSIFFISLYFLYLITNTLIIFFYPNEKK